MKEKDLEENEIYDEEENTDFTDLEGILSDEELKELDRLSRKFDSLGDEIDDLDTKIYDSITDLYTTLKLEEMPEAEITSKINEIINMLKQMDKMELEFVETLMKMMQIFLDAEMRMVEDIISFKYIDKNKIKELRDDIENQKKEADKLGELLVRLNDSTKELIDVMKKVEQNVSQRLELLKQAIKIITKRGEMYYEIEKISTEMLI
ncbi:MAG: hypothetical protein QW046_05940 [Candidatus Micrarchaeaceae archaeon]